MTQKPERRYLGKLPDERDAAREGRLLVAAKAMFGSQGYAATTVDRICAAAKVSTRNFYQHFDNKEAIFLAVYEEVTRKSFERASAVLEETAGQSIVERIPRAFLAYIAPMIEDVHTTRIAFVEIVGASERIEQRRLAFREALVDLIEMEGTKAVEMGDIQPRNFRVAALALAGAANAIVYDWSLSSGDAPVEELEAELAELALVLLAGERPERPVKT